LSIPKFAQRSRQMLANFGIGTLANKRASDGCGQSARVAAAQRRPRRRQRRYRRRARGGALGLAVGEARQRVISVRILRAVADDQWLVVAEVEPHAAPDAVEILLADAAFEEGARQNAARDRHCELGAERQRVDAALVAVAHIGGPIV